MNLWQKYLDRPKTPYSGKVYDALPFVYITAGLITILSLRNGVALASGLILMGVGAGVWALRYRYRRPFIQSKGHIGIPAMLLGATPARELMELTWQDSYECGHPVIDAQHRRLFGICNELIYTAMSSGKRANTLFRLTELINHTIVHFRTEEALLTHAKHPLAKEHQKCHADLLAKAKQLRDQYLKYEIGARELVGFIAYDVITGHILKEDLKWASHKPSPFKPGKMSLKIKDTHSNHVSG